MSPVFKVMFKSDFREKGQQQIPLPGKKARTFLSFLLTVYSREDDDEVNSEYKRKKHRYNNFNQHYNNSLNLCSTKGIVLAKPLAFTLYIELLGPGWPIAVIWQQTYLPSAFLRLFNATSHHK